MVNRWRFTAKEIIDEILLDSESEEEQELLDDELDSSSDKDFADIRGEEV